MDITKIALDVPCDGYACFKPAKNLVGNPAVPQTCLRLCDKHLGELGDAFIELRKPDIDKYVDLQKSKIEKDAIKSLKADDLIKMLDGMKLNKTQKRALAAMGKGD
jgi:hypothetical protein